MIDNAIRRVDIVHRIGGNFDFPLVRNVIAGRGGGFSPSCSTCLTLLIFSGPLTPWLSYGMAATFITGAIGGAVMSLSSSLPFAIGGPDGSTSAVTAALVTALTGQMAAKGADGGLLTATLVALALSSALTGVVLCGLGVARAGRAIRFVPYPVIGGFIGASGCLMLLGASRC